MKNRKFAYIRVSSRDQNVARQLDTMRGLGIEEHNIFIDKASKKDFDREQLQLMKKTVRDGDIIYIEDLSRVGINKRQIFQEWYELTQEIKAHVVILDLPALDTRKFINASQEFVDELVLQIFEWVAEDERRKNLRAQREGFESAKARGVKLGRKKIPMTEDFLEAYKRWKLGEITALEAMKVAKLKKGTFYNMARCYEEENKKE